MTSLANALISSMAMFIVGLLTALEPWAGSESLHGGEYCDTEVFRAECPENEVIILEKAIYGRMKVGRCVEISLGHIGCQRNVIQTADRRCSGKRVCEIRIPDAEFESFKPCLKELKTYLEASYRCVKVETVTTDYCKAHDRLHVTSFPSGYIASIVTSDTPHCDGSSHPWIISARTGQQINLTLYDFALDRVVHTTAPSGGPTPCVHYGLIEDNGYDRPIPLCGANTRIFALYRSIGNVVRIWVTAGSAPTDLKRFVIHYSVFGCADPSVEENTIFTRKNDRQGIMKCLFSDVTSVMECSSENKWEGQAINCTRSDHWPSLVEESAAVAAPAAGSASEVTRVAPVQHFDKQPHRTGYGAISSIVLTFILLTGAAVALLAITLIVCIVRCHRHNGKRFEPLALRKSQKEPDCPSDVNKSCQLANATVTALTEPLIGVRQQRHPVRVNGNDYEHIWQATLQQQYIYTDTTRPTASPVVFCKTFKPDLKTISSMPEYQGNSPQVESSLTDV